MLSRVADNLYWMSRYLERAEHTARLLDVSLNLSLEQLPRSAEQHWLRLLASLNRAWPEGRAVDPYAITNMLTFDATEQASIVACIGASRENARQVREQISSEMWEQLNQLFLKVRGSTIEIIWPLQAWEYFRAIKEGSHLFQGITDSTLSHGEGWMFIDLGRYIERASSVIKVLDAHFSAINRNALIAQDSTECVGLLKSCTAFEAYCKVYTADMRLDRVAEFLLLNDQFPHSVCFSIDRIQYALEHIMVATKLSKSGRVNRLAGRLRSAVDFSQIDEIMASGVQDYLRGIHAQYDALHDEIHQTYIDYPIDAALVS